MAAFPVVGIFREPLLILEATVSLFGIEFGLIFLHRFLKEKKERNMIIAWSVFFFSFSAMMGIYIVSDFFTAPADRQFIVNFGYLAMGLGALTFTFNAERELEFNRHILSLFLVALLLIMTVDFFFLFVDPIFIVYACWIPFIFTLLLYIARVMKRIKEYKINIFGFFGGFLIYALGYAATIDALVEEFGYITRLLGDISIIIGMGLISLGFIGLPSMREIDWEKKLNKLLLLHTSGTCICDYNFVDLTVETDARQIPIEFMAGGLMGVTQMIPELIHSRERVKILDHQDKKVIFAHGDHLVAALVADEYLEIYKRKLNKFIESLEMIYTGLLEDWQGSLTYLKPVEKLIKNIFS